MLCNALEPDCDEEEFEELLSTYEVDWLQVDKYAVRGLVTLLDDLAGIYLFQSKFSLAEKTIARAIIIGKKMDGEGNPALSDSIMIQTHIYRRQEKVSEAIDILTDFIRFASAKYGDENVYLLNPYLLLGKIYRSQKCYPQAMELLVKALGIKAKPWQEYNFDCTSQICLELALVYSLQGDVAEAERRFLQVVSLCITKKDLTYKRKAYQGLAKLYKQQINDKLAILYKLQIKDTDVLLKYIELLEIIEDDDEFEGSSLTLEIDTTEIARKEELRSDLGNAYYNLATAYRNDGDNKEAKRKFKLASARLQAKTPEEALILIETNKELADLYLAQKQKEKVAACIRKSLQLIEEKSMDVVDLPVLYQSLLEQHQSPGVLEKFEQEIALKEQEESPDLVAEYNLAGMIYHSQGNWEQGLDSVLKATHLSQQTGGHIHREIAASIDTSLKNSSDGDFVEAIKGLAYAMKMWKTRIRDSSALASELFSENRYILHAYLMFAWKSINICDSILVESALADIASFWVLSSTADMLLITRFTQCISSMNIRLYPAEGLTRDAIQQAAAVAEDPLGMGCLYLLLAWLNFLQRQFPIAEEVCQKSIEVLRTLQEGAQREVNLAYCTLVDIYTTQGRLPEAIYYWQTVRKNVETVRLYFTAMLTQLYVNRGDIGTALLKYSPEEMFSGFGRAYYILGWVYYVYNQPQAAGQYLNYCITLHNKMHKEEDLTVAHSQMMMAMIKRDCGDFHASQALYRNSLYLLTKQHGAEHFGTAICSIELAKVCKEVGDHAEARSLYLAGITVLERIPDLDPSVLIDAYAQMSDLI